MYILHRVAFILYLFVCLKKKIGVISGSFESHGALYKMLSINKIYHNIAGNNKKVYSKDYYIFLLFYIYIYLGAVLDFPLESFDIN